MTLSQRCMKTIARRTAYHVHSSLLSTTQTQISPRRTISNGRWTTTTMMTTTIVDRRQIPSASTIKTPNPTSRRNLATTPTPPQIAYAAPFASLSLRLKRISISTAALSLLGVPLLLLFDCGSAAVPATGQLAVGGTAVLAATGSTAALSYCFSPYVHSLEWITVRCPSCVDRRDSDDGGGDGNGGREGVQSEKEKMLLKAVTRNVFAVSVETIFDPRTDVVFEGVAKKTNRPFCNFIAKGVPLYVHPQLIEDVELRTLLVGGDGDGNDGGDTVKGGDGVATTVEGDLGGQKKKKVDDNVS